MAIQIEAAGSPVIRQGDTEATSTPAAAETITTNGTEHRPKTERRETPPEAPGEAGETTRGWLDDPEKTRLLLVAIREVNAMGSHPQDRFAELLSERVGWKKANRHEIGGVFTSLVRRGYIVRIFRGSRPYGYELTEEGRALIHDLIHPATPTPSPAVPRTAPTAPTSVDLAAVIRSFDPIARRFLEANARLGAIEAREAELNAELARIRQEKEQICQFLADQEVRSLLSHLLTVARPRT
jgi:hypothetical protein